MHDPIAEFQRLFERAARREAHDHTAMTLATADAAGRPSARMVLLKRVDERGFVFYTNYESRKARELDENPVAALCVYWSSLSRQVRIEGPVERLSAAESDAYFATRSRGSQLGAWASRQSRTLASRFGMLRDYARLRLQHAGSEVPRPPFWGGYLLRPESVEFWSGELYRLHDRRLFTREGAEWSMRRLYP